MRLQRGLAISIILILVISCAVWMIEPNPALMEQELPFQIIASGGLSGNSEEEYLVIRTNTGWEALWTKHVIFVMPPPPAPGIDFSSELVVCAFMGERSTGGYSISIEQVWAYKGEIHVEVVKHSPPPDTAVVQVVTFPYVFVSMEKTAMDFTFDVTDEDGRNSSYQLPRSPDVTGDGLCCVDDIIEVAARFGSTLNQSNWQPKYDIDRDSFVGVTDIIEVACSVGRTYS
jgi:hypothetical protein